MLGDASSLSLGIDAGRLPLRMARRCRAPQERRHCGAGIKLPKATRRIADLAGGSSIQVECRPRCQRPARGSNKGRRLARR